ncbi:hypothetical protein B0H67DRAFT_298133 [Lasiosphaeris hirsuta]|uniref:Uncharacterized protein n=1 Tax=Lasiosphaeris hirsuta TaxID=260670 RepID=A0AA40A9A9_9PEZI|nr:hypothetical protein B0H67DRAFT_298133 [Lasiosphaeris hirsuta]
MLTGCLQQLEFVRLWMLVRQLVELFVLLRLLLRLLILLHCTCNPSPFRPISSCPPPWWTGSTGSAECVVVAVAVIPMPLLAPLARTGTIDSSWLPNPDMAASLASTEPASPHNTSPRYLIALVVSWLACALGRGYLYKSSATQYSAMPSPVAPRPDSEIPLSCSPLCLLIRDSPGSW